MSRIDRFLFTADWAESFINISKKRLIQMNSDNFPISLECGNIQRKRRPFRFENMWLKAEGFTEKVQSWWDSYQVDGTPSYIFAQKLKALKGDLKKWNETEFGNINLQKKQLQADLRVLDEMEDVRPLTIEEKGKREGLIVELDKVLC